MGARKIVNEQEVIGWFKDGLTYQEMTDRYREQYDIETTPSTWSNFRHRRGLDRKHVRNDDLIPWEVKVEHRWKYAIKMLRFEARVRSGGEISPQDKHQLANFHAYLNGNNPWGEPVVVHYEPDLESGFVFVPREEADDDIIRRPLVKTTTRSSRDR